MQEEIKYGATAYRYILKEAGAIAHSLALHATKLNLGICEVGAFDDKFISQELDIDSDEEFVVSFLCLGKNRKVLH